MQKKKRGGGKVQKKKKEGGEGDHQTNMEAEIAKETLYIIFIFFFFSF